MYVQPSELAKQLGKPSLVDPNLDICCLSATELINDWVGRSPDDDMDPVPATVTRVALSLAVDLWKQPDATFGIAGIGETGPVRIARDLVARYDSLLIPYYMPRSTDAVSGAVRGGWGVA